jgi:hypothetical protein
LEKTVLVEPTRSAAPPIMVGTYSPNASIAAPPALRVAILSVSDGSQRGNFSS